METNPIRHKLTIDQNRHYHCHPKFIGHANKPSPKIYIVSRNGQIFYVGITRQRIGSRIYGGFAANVYKWPVNTPMNFDIWILPAIKGDKSKVKSKLETIEAEIVFCVRQKTDKWPSYQKAIHFHKSSKAERQIAFNIYNFYTR
ncbi:MAG: hypothetical protein ACREDS_13700 [Limisphaerales bacterium]